MDRTGWREYNQPCPCGDSSDGYAVRKDGSGYCFSCSKNFAGVDLENQEQSQDVEYDFISHRGIARRTFEFFGVKTKFINGEPESVMFPYGDDAGKVRNLRNKRDMRCIGEFSRAKLFGQGLFPPGSKESITLFEGEFDALAGFEMLKGKSACVSIKSGAGGALRDCRENWDYINSFSKIYLCFDNDEHGDQATKSLQGLFDFQKVYHVKMKFKDANEYLEKNSLGEFYEAWHGAKRFTPDNIISSFSEIEKALEESREDQLGEYPFSGLNEKLYGLHAGEVVVVKAPEGVGKTEFFRALEHNLLKTTDHPIGIIHLEEDNGTTVKAISGYELGVPAVLPDCGLSKQDILDGYRKAVRDEEGRLHIHSSFDTEDESAFLGNIRFLVSAAGCRFIFLDHISWLATGTDDEDERRKLDRISQKLKLLAKELRFCLVMISHVNDEGKTRGSRNITKVANTVISLDRDILGDSPFVHFLIEKARLGGRTGKAGSGYFDRDSGKLLNQPPHMEEEDDS